MLLVLVARYRDLDLEAAARLHSVSSPMAQQLLAGSSAVSGAVVLSTCTRFEIYCEISPGADVATARTDTLSTLSDYAGLPVWQLSSLFEHSYGPSVTEHLFAVGTGLDSVVVGEREISGQVRRALAEAQASGTASGRLVRLFQAASRESKHVRARTTISSASRSIASVALDLAAAGSAHGTLSELSVVLFGTGSYAGCITELLKSKQCPAISVFSRSGRAEEFVTARGGTALTSTVLPEAIAGADILIGCSGSGTRIGASTLALWRRSATHPLIVVDLAPSHDFDPRVGTLPGVELITLESVHLAALQADAEALSNAHALVRQAAQRFEQEEEIRVIDTAIVALRRHVQQVLDAEMDGVRNQHGCAATAVEVNLALRRIVRRLLHVPTVRARELALAGRPNDYTAALDALFGITVQLTDTQQPAGETF